MKIISCALLFGATITSVCAQEVIPPIGTPFLLPGSMKANFIHGEAERFFLSDQASGSLVRCGVTFSNTGEDSYIGLRWLYKTQNTSGRTEKEVHTTAYLPTAVTQFSGTSDKFYVAGWYDRSRVAVIEEWQITNVAVGENIPEGGGSPVPTLTTPTIVRRLLLSTFGEQARPIECIAVDPFEQYLYALEYGPEARLSRLSLTATSDPHQLDPFATASAIGVTTEIVPDLAKTRSMKVGYHDQKGLVIVLRRHAPWSGQFGQDRAVIYDADGDGVINHTSIPTMSREAYLGLFPPGFWTESF